MVPTGEEHSQIELDEASMILHEFDCCAPLIYYQRKFSWETSEIRRFKNAKSPVQ